MIVVHFGKEKVENGICNITGGINKKENYVFPGEYHLFSITNSELPISNGEKHCFKWSIMKSTDESDHNGNDNMKGMFKGIFSIK